MYFEFDEKKQLFALRHVVGGCDLVICLVSAEISCKALVDENTTLRSNSFVCWRARFASADTKYPLSPRRVSEKRSWTIRGPTSLALQQLIS